MAVLPWDHPDFFATGLAARATDTGHLGCRVNTARDDRYYCHVLTGIMMVVGLLTGV